jgi:hypothetical protein
MATTTTTAVETKNRMVAKVVFKSIVNPARCNVFALGNAQRVRHHEIGSYGHPMAQKLPEANILQGHDCPFEYYR